MIDYIIPNVDIDEDFKNGLIRSLSLGKDDYTNEDVNLLVKFAQDVHTDMLFLVHASLGHIKINIKDDLVYFEVTKDGKNFLHQLQRENEKYKENNI